MPGMPYTLEHGLLVLLTEILFNYFFQFLRSCLHTEDLKSKEMETGHRHDVDTNTGYGHDTDTETGHRDNKKNIGYIQGEDTSINIKIYMFSCAMSI